MTATHQTTRRRSPTRRKSTVEFVESVQQEAETVSHLVSLHVQQSGTLGMAMQKFRVKRLVKMKEFLSKCQTSPMEGLNAPMVAVMKRTLEGLESTGSDLAFGRWLTRRHEQRRAVFFEKMHKKLARRGRWLQKITKVSEEKAAQARAHEDDARSDIWTVICRKQIPKAARIMNQTISARLSNAKKVAALCAKEQQKAQHKLRRTEVRDVNARSRRALKEMLQFWKRNEREERDLRKRAEKEASERRRQEEEEREARRQEKKLHFLLTQTELYSHFIARKSGTTAPQAASAVKKLAVGIDFADLDDSALSAQAQLAAQSAVASHQEKLRKFDNESDRHRKDAGGETSTLGQELDHLDFKVPSTLADIQHEVRQPRMLHCQLKGYQIKGLTWLAHLYEQVCP